MILAALLGLEVVAVILAERVVQARALTRLLWFALLDEVAVAMLQKFVLHDAPRPFTGPARLAYHVETALVIGWPAALCAVAWSTFRRRGARWVATAWAVALAGLVVAYPLPRGWTAPVLHLLEGAAVVAAAVAIARSWGTATLSSRPGVAVGLLVVVEGAVSILGAWGDGAGVFTRWDELARLPYALGWGVLNVHMLVWGMPWKRPS